MTNPGEALARLRRAAASGELGRLCASYGVSLLVAFGSAVRRGTKAADVDLGVRFDGGNRDILGFLDHLTEIAGTSALDVMDLGTAGPVARERALVGGVPLTERAPGEFARAQIAAMMERMDTDWLRRLDLSLMMR